MKKLVTLTCLLVLLGCIVFAVVRLYKADSASDAVHAPEGWAVLSAVPSDAVAVLVFDGTSRARSVLADSTGILRSVIAKDTPELMDYLQAVVRHKTAISLHNSGNLVPLVITETARLDSAGVSFLEQRAQDDGLKTRRCGGFLAVSPSETFVGAAARGVKEGSSLLDNPAFVRIAERASGPVVTFLSHAHAGKLLQVYSTPKLRQQASLVKDLTAWSAIGLQALEADHLQFKGVALPGDASGSRLSAFAGTPAQAASFPEALPYNTSAAFSLPVGDPGATLQALRSLQDAAGRLNAYDKFLKAKAGRPLSPEEWFRSLQPRELVYASFLTQEGVERSVVLLRSAKDPGLGQEAPNPYAGVLGGILGGPFAVTDTVCASVGGKWSVFGDLPAVRAFVARDSYSLKERLADADIPLPQGFTAYGSFSDDPALLQGLFSAPLSDAFLAWVRGSGYAPAFLEADLSSPEAPSFTVRLDKRVLKGTKVQVLERDTTVVVPTGLFPVKNYATGQTNYLYQNSHLSICLNDENNKGVWGIPFKQPLCGRVESIDYYNNGKLQFLFAAGRELWLLDRLGHWVNGFPVKLPKEVLLGPAAHDFTGAGGYTVMVLHKDNTLERYNLHGIKPEGWKGIAAPETVKALPELLETPFGNFWAVRTSVRTLIYPFEGGEPVGREEGGKMFKPDANLVVTGRGVQAECYDGKVRELKLK